MATVSIGAWEMDEEELDQQHEIAVKRGKQLVEQEAQAKQVRYDELNQRLVIELKNDVQFSIPCRLIQGIQSAAPADIAEFQLGARGASLHWQKLDVDLSITGLLAGLFGTQLWMSRLGQLGGRVTSTAKRAAARENGKKGGRPKTESLKQLS